MIRHESQQGRGLGTLAVHGPGVQHALATPIERATAGIDRGEPTYSRIENPTVQAVARRLAALEVAEDALLLASGTAALLTGLLSTVRPGGLVVAARQVCGDAHRLLARELPALGRNVVFVDLADRAAWWAASEGADALYVEALTNPLLAVADLPWLGSLAARRGAALLVDATLATPINVQPLVHGATLVLHSATKGLNGHADVVAGVIAGAFVPVARAREVAIGLGAPLDPGAAALLERGLKTLVLRVDRQNETAAFVARVLQARPEIRTVLHPSLPNHPDHVLASRLLGGTAGLVSLVLRDGDAVAERFVAELELIRTLPTLGGVESLAATAAAGTHRELGESGRAAAGISPGTVRLSLGIEDVDDLVTDLEGALRTLRPWRRPRLSRSQLPAPAR